jgi:predicted small lipoprotein YifL
MKFSEKIAAAMLAAILLVALPGCDNQGPLEEAGENIDDGVRDTGDAIEDATDGR